MQIEFDIEPMGAVRSTQGSKWSSRSQKYYAHMNLTKYLAMEQHYAPGKSLRATFVIAMPKSWSKKKRADMLHAPCESKPDIDNIIKWWLDSLCAEDKQVHSVNCRKVWGERGKVIINEGV